MIRFYRAVLPYGEPRFIDDVVFNRGDFKPRALRPTQRGLSVVDLSRNALGVVDSMDDRADGLHLVIETLESTALRCGMDYGYYADVVIDRRSSTLLGIAVSSIETWDAARLRRITGTNVPPPIPPRPAVDFSPIPPLV